MKDIPGYEGRYAVTEDGRVWSYPKLRGYGMTKGKLKTAGGYFWRFVILSK